MEPWYFFIYRSSVAAAPKTSSLYALRRAAKRGKVGNTLSTLVGGRVDSSAPKSVPSRRAHSRTRAADADPKKFSDANRECSCAFSKSSRKMQTYLSMQEPTYSMYSISNEAGRLWQAVGRGDHPSVHSRKLVNLYWSACTVATLVLNLNVLYSLRWIR